MRSERITIAPSTLRLELVVELEGGELPEELQQDYPPGSSWEYPEEWSARQVMRWASLGLGQLRPAQVGQMMLGLDQLERREVLLAVMAPRLMIDLEHVDQLEQRFEEQVAATELDHVGALCGGYLLRDGDSLVLPQCCGDLADLSGWQDLAEMEVDEVMSVWIGHPMLMVERRGDRLRCWGEDGAPSVLAGREEIELSQRSLLEAIPEAMAQRDQLRAWIEDCLQCWLSPDRASAFAARLVGVG